MVQSISASVGRLGGSNRPADVRVVQSLLNRVAPASGGPSPLLAVDSVCGAKTVDAIQKFQIRHFGWAKADGRVDPNGPTLRKLKEFSGPASTDGPAPLTVHSILRCPHGGAVRVSIAGRPATSPSGAALLRSSDRFDVAGCAFPGRPCVRVHWVVFSDPLNEKSVGLCLSASGTPNGQVVILAAVLPSRAAVSRPA